MAEEKGTNQLAWPPNPRRQEEKGGRNECSARVLGKLKTKRDHAVDFSQPSAENDPNSKQERRDKKGKEKRRLNQKLRKTPLGDGESPGRGA